ncbi:MAG: DUF1572 family protein [Gemmata sp.]
MRAELRSALNHAVRDELDAALSRIAHCTHQLTDEQVWWRPPHGMNAIGNLILHLTGNVRQVIASNLTGAPDTRDRPAEFAARAVMPKAEIMRALTNAVEAAKSGLDRATDEQLATGSRVNNFDWTGIQAVIRSVAHFRGHTQ